MAARYAGTVELTDAQMKELAQKPNTRVLGVHETPPTALKEELWPGTQVAAAFVELRRARIARDKEARCRRSSAPERASQIVARTSRPTSFWLTFRRIYPTFWKAALWKETTDADAEQLLGLIAQLEN